MSSWSRRSASSFAYCSCFLDWLTPGRVIDPPCLREYRAHLDAKGVSNATRERVAYALERFFQWVADTKGITEIPSARQILLEQPARPVLPPSQRPRANPAEPWRSIYTEQGWQDLLRRLEEAGGPSGAYVRGER